MTGDDRQNRSNGSILEKAETEIVGGKRNKLIVGVYF
jgi:hypothetical protein